MSEESDGSPSTDTEAEEGSWSEGWESAVDHAAEEEAASEEVAAGGEAPTSPEPDRESDESETGDGEEYEPSIAGVFGARPEDAPPRPEIVPETPSLENVLFVVLGVLFGLFVLYRAATVFAG